jgi:DNA-binding NtrC family response regulator
MTKDLQLQMKERFDGLMDDLMNAGFFLEQAVEILERGMIERSLRLTNTNQSGAAKLLGIHRNTLQRKMVEHNIDGKRPRRKPASRATGKAGSARRPRRAS